MKAFREGRYAEAVRELRAARFSTLENPARHLEVLARLALAEDAAGAAPARIATLERFYTIERRFGAFEASSLEPDLRARFLQLVEQNIGRERILQVPTLAAELGYIPVRPTRPRPTAPASPVATPVPPSPTATARSMEPPLASPTAPVTETAAPAPAATATPSRTPSGVPSSTPQPPTSSPTGTATFTPTAAPTQRPSPTRTATETGTPAPTATATPSPTRTATLTRTAAPTPRPSPTQTATPSPTRTATLTRTAAPTPRPSPTQTATVTATATATATWTPAPSATASRTATPLPTRTATRTATAEPSATYTPRSSPTLSLQFVSPDLVDTPPRVLEMVMPVYPERALKERVRGLVVLKVLVSEDGAPVRIAVEKAAREDLTRSAIAAAGQWRFEPARKNGRPVRTFTTLRFPFEGIQFARTPFEQSESSSAPQLTTTPTLAPARTEERWRERTPRPSPNWRERTPRPTQGPGGSSSR